jgi:hypothetical protein
VGISRQVLKSLSSERIVSVSEKREKSFELRQPALGGVLRIHPRLSQITQSEVMNHVSKNRVTW